MSGRGLLIFAICFAAVAVRCWQINAPFDDHWSWRQSDVAAIARNYAENGYHFARPQIDWAGAEPGYVGTEFPALPFVAATFYRATGPREWVGRVETILCFIFSLPFLFFLARRAFGRDAALYALVFYGFAPLAIASSRAFLPDMPSLALGLAALYFFWRWLDERRTTDFAISAALLALSVLLKLPTAVMGAAFFSLTLGSWRSGRGPGVFARKLSPGEICLFAAIALLPSVLWYGHAALVARDFYPHHLFGAGGVRLMPPHWYGEIARVTVVESLTPILVLLALGGIFVTRKNPKAAPFRWWLSGMILFMIVVGYGNRHPWYQLPLVPIAAVFAGAFIGQIQWRWLQVVCVASFLVWSAFAARQHFLPAAEPALALGRELQQQTPTRALIMIADDGDPTALYYGHRKGWHLLEAGGVFYGNPSDGRQIIDNVEKLRARGATYFACLRGTKWWLEVYPEFTDYLARHASLVSANDDYRLYHFSP